MEKWLENKSPALIGFLQAALLTVYCGLIALFFYSMAKFPVQPGFFGFFLMLALFVFSAAITGSLVFGYSTYLALVKNRIKEALTILIYTLLFILIIILATVILIILL